MSWKFCNELANLLALHLPFLFSKALLGIGRSVVRCSLSGLESQILTPLHIIIVKRSG